MTNGQLFLSLFHITDWFSTLLNLAGSNDILDVDGIDQWTSITSKGETCQREL
jgi:arylsulfatase A-like enzyme